VSSYFNLIEINSTFYRIPLQKQCRSWLGRVHDRADFQFTVKAFRDFTHAKPPAGYEAVAQFKDGVYPIFEGGRLGAVLIQFPWSYRFSTPACDHILELHNRLSPFPTSIEVRHGSWGSLSAIEFFRQHALTLCGIDQPVIGNSLTDRTYLPGASGAYFRLHGRNREEWFKRETNRDLRYNYLYSEKELSAWADRVGDIANRVESVYLVLNNHFRGQAVVNALQLKAMLSGEKTAIPKSLLELYPQLRTIAEPAAGGAEDARSGPEDQGTLF
jgi:uncharacterized protein YecE (DUF72 family)